MSRLLHFRCLTVLVKLNLVSNSIELIESIDLRPDLDGSRYDFKKS